MSRIFIGTSGWQYAHWRGSFYPEDLPSSRWLAYYARFFNTVEVNSSFYHQTRGSTFQKWQEQVAKDFVFAVKGHRFITHIKRLHEVGEAVKLYFHHVNMLTCGDKTPHVILWQLPPSLKKDAGRLTAFLEFLPKRFRHAFEFRNETWIDEEVFSILEESDRECTAVLQDWKEWPRFIKPIGHFVYIRFHGRKKLYASNYSDKELSEWAEKISHWRQRGLDIYAYFNNDSRGYAVPNARKLTEQINGYLSPLETTNSSGRINLSTSE